MNSNICFATDSIKFLNSVQPCNNENAISWRNLKNWPSANFFTSWRNLKPLLPPVIICFCASSKTKEKNSTSSLVLTKTRYNLKRSETTWNDLQRPTTSKKRPETTHNEKNTTYNDPNLPTTSKKKMRKDQQQADFEIILQYGAIGSLLWHVFSTPFGCNHSNIALLRIIVKMERQTFPHYHMYLLRDTKFTGYVENHFDTRKLTFVKEQSTLRIKQKKSNFDTDTTFRALKVATW